MFDHSSVTFGYANVVELILSASVDELKFAKLQSTHEGLNSNLLGFS